MPEAKTRGDPADLPLEELFREMSMNEKRPKYTASNETTYKSKIFETYEHNSVNSFERPIWYRVVHSESPPEYKGSLQSRLYQPLEAAEKIRTETMRNHVINHAKLSNTDHDTPFISVTNDLIRAFNIAYSTYSQKKNVTILLICPWLLAEGSYAECNDLREKCSLQRDPKYNTEILVWGDIPAKSILCRWPRQELDRSGLFHVFPSLGKLRGEEDDKCQHSTSNRRKELCDDYKSFYPAKVESFPGEIADALVFLGMDPSRLQIKQIFLFLLGQARGFAVEKIMGGVEAELEKDETCKGAIEQFDEAVYRLSMLAWKRTLMERFGDDDAERICRDLKKRDRYLETKDQAKRRWDDIAMTDILKPSLGNWLFRRKMHNLSERKIQLGIDEGEPVGLNKWLSRPKRYTIHTGLGDDD